MTLTPDQLVAREVHYCVSFLVSTLAGGMSCSIHSELRAREARNNLAAIVNAAFELCCPIDDYEEAAIQAGWERSGFLWTRQNSEGYWRTATSLKEACEESNLEPYQREVFEHWIVSDWLADRLAEKGEKVDKDFAGMTVWARTTTGQAIKLDYVIETICADLNAKA